MLSVPVSVSVVEKGRRRHRKPMRHFAHNGKHDVVTEGVVVVELMVAVIVVVI